MLTQIEIGKFNLIYTTCCKFYTIPISWNNRRMSLNANPSIVRWNYIAWLLLIANLIFEIKQFPALIWENNVNGVILHGAVVVGHVGYGFLKLNILLFKDEIVQLNNQVLEINSCWGT